MVRRAIASHPDVRFADELFNAANQRPDSYNRFVEEHAPAPRLPVVGSIASTRAFLRSVYAIGEPRATGLTLMYNHLKQHPEVLPLLAVFRVRLIHLMRRNVLKTAVSAALARHRRLWWSSAPVAVEAVHIDPATLLCELGRRERLITLHRCLLRPFNPLELYYEDVIADPASHYSSVLRSLGIDDGREVTTDTVKLTSDRLHDVVANYYEIADGLAGTRYARYLTAEGP